ncbi:MULTISPECIES: hypothetical protein [unclassified Pseudomonas]|uniref:hypothetical protein n=1 Tax=unclassified Pseudomonas TaxID=196821 RepID=UPI00211503D4|nr:MULTISPECIES: hypothetical protein [unclassified Pseudomonas]
MADSDIHLSDSSDSGLFQRIADELQQTLSGTWTTQASGLDQYYGTWRSMVR